MKQTKLVQNNYTDCDKELLIFGNLLLEDLIIINTEEIIEIDSNQEMKEEIKQIKNLEELKLYIKIK